ncbi:Hexokinase [Penicillium hispanicum]|uniref:Hexokinase n=1 Tax=Penicillium hispanicum TaxID=1080232 RepID=UPI002541E2DD|nr:Hexokinase [Penicillium hispanicum]KAJ5570182.1 Hexokinase [Penicillium hispanicum]
MSGFCYSPEILEGMPRWLISELKQYEDWFVIEAPELKKITDHFVKELERGLTKDGGNIPMNVTWVMEFPSGGEEGRILTLDMGGTYLRVCEVCFSQGQGDFEQTQRKFRLPEEVKTGSTAEQLWDWIAEHLQVFLHEHHAGGQFVALINDTTGTLIASHYRDPQIKIGSIFSTGCNAAYMEECRYIPKLRGLGLPENANVIINTEYGAFDNDRKVLPLTKFDHKIDEESIRPGTQIFEKMVAGLYIGEVLRLILVTLHEEGKMFEGQDITHLRKENALEASFLSIAETDFSPGLDEMRKEFEKTLSLTPSLDELKACRYLIVLVGTRAARLYACGIAAIYKKKDLRKCHVGVDGAVFNRYRGFKERALQGLRDIFDWPPGELELISLNPSEDGSSVGAALAAALVLKAEQKEKSVEQ